MNQFSHRKSCVFDLDYLFASKDRCKMLPLFKTNTSPTIDLHSVEIRSQPQREHYYIASALKSQFESASRSLPNRTRSLTQANHRTTLSRLT